MPILERSFVGTPSNALCGLHARVETALGEGDKVVTIMQVKSSIHYKLSIVYLPCIVNQGWFKICRSVGRFIGTTFSNELIKFFASVEMKLINKD